MTVGAWEYEARGSTGWTVPLVLLDTDIEPNAPADWELGAWLYGGDQRYRLAQEIVLGIGGVRMLRALGYRDVQRFHMNEGHASLLALELLREQPDADPLVESIEAVKRQCVFTTHTPVPAGHDQFPYELVDAVLGRVVPLDELRMPGGQERLNMTLLALNLASYVNGVAKRNGEVSQQLFPGYAIDAVTNGVHSFAWTCERSAACTTVTFPAGRAIRSRSGMRSRSRPRRSGRRTSRPRERSWRRCGGGQRALSPSRR